MGGGMGQAMGGYYGAAYGPLGASMAAAAAAAAQQNALNAALQPNSQVREYHHTTAVVADVYTKRGFWFFWFWLIKLLS